MSKITICEGEILYTSKGDTIIHAFDGNITTHAQEKNIWEGKNGTLIGDYVPMEFPKAEDKFVAPLSNIIINFLRSESAGAFINQEFEDNGWKVIDASSIKNASIKLKAYLGNLKADNIYINTHGGSRKDPILDESGNKIPNLKTKRNDDFLTYENSAIRLGASWIFASDFIEYVDAEKKKLLTEQTILDIEGMIKIGNMVTEGKNLILGSCNTSMNDNFGKILVSLITTKIDVFINNNMTLSYTVSNKISFQHFTSYAQSDKKSTLGWDRFTKGKVKKVYKNLIINKFGVKVVQ